MTLSVCGQGTDPGTIKAMVAVLADQIKLQTDALGLWSYLKIEYDFFSAYWHGTDESGNMNGQIYYGSPSARIFAFTEGLLCRSLGTARNRFDDARRFADIANKIDAVEMVLGKDGKPDTGSAALLQEAVVFDKKTRLEGGTDPRLETYYSGMINIYTNSGLLRYLSGTVKIATLFPVFSTEEYSIMLAQDSRTCDYCYRYLTEEECMANSICQGKSVLPGCQFCKQAGLDDMAAKYCSKECQHKDWRERHKYYCKKIRNATEKLKIIKAAKAASGEEAATEVSSTTVEETMHDSLVDGTFSVEELQSAYESCKIQ